MGANGCNCQDNKRLWYGKSGESVNTTHQTKKLDVDDLMYYRDRSMYL